MAKVCMACGGGTMTNNEALNAIAKALKAGGR